MSAFAHAPGPLPQALTGGSGWWWQNSSHLIGWINSAWAGRHSSTFVTSLGPVWLGKTPASAWRCRWRNALQWLCGVWRPTSNTAPSAPYLVWGSPPCAGVSETCVTPLWRSSAPSICVPPTSRSWRIQPSSSWPIGASLTVLLP